MGRVVVDDFVKSQLNRIVEPCEVFDSAGVKLGLFTPDEYVGYECPLSDEALTRIEQQGGGRPLADILADLEKHA